MKLAPRFLAWRGKGRRAGAGGLDPVEDGAVVATTLGAVDARRVAVGRPVRLPPAYAGQRHYAVLFWSATMGGNVVYESRLELDRL